MALFKFALIFISAWFVAAQALTKDDCPSTVHDRSFLQVFGDSCFWFHLDHVKEWAKARKACQQEGGDLALIKNKSTQDFLVDQLWNTYGYQNKATEIWFGLSDETTEEKYMWVDGTPLNVNDYNDWTPGNGPGHPGHGFHDCVALDPSEHFRWKQLHCETEIFILANHKFFICEARVMTTTQNPVTVTCPPFVCAVDCGMDGYKVDGNGCTLCECNVPTK